MNSAIQPPAAGEAAHTPTPWTFDEVPTSCGRAFRIGSREIIDNHEASKGHGVRTLPAYAVIYDDYGHGETVNKANAAFIVRACNEYDDLIVAKGEAEQAAEAAGKEIDLLTRDKEALVKEIAELREELADAEEAGNKVLMESRWGQEYQKACIKISEQHDEIERLRAALAKEGQS